MYIVRDLSHHDRLCTLPSVCENLQCILGSHTEEMICTLCKNKIGEAIKHVQETVNKPTLLGHPKGKSSLGQPLPWSSKDTEQSASTIQSYPEVIKGGLRQVRDFMKKKSFDRFS